MANNPYVNKVQFGNSTVMDISDADVQESDVAEGKIFYKGTGQRSVGNGNYYSPNDTAETAIDDADYFPFYDTSATAKRKTLWSNIKSVLNSVFFKRSEQRVLGAKNLLVYPYQSTTSTINNVTFTDNGNGTITVGTDGAASGNTAFEFYTLDMCKAHLTAGGQYSLSGGTESVEIGEQNLQTSDASHYSTGDDLAITVRSDLATATGYVAIKLLVRSGTTISTPITIYPMLRLASDPDDTYVPYAMTNKELTDKVEGLAWSDISNKPFTSIGYGLDVNSQGVLKPKVGDISTISNIYEDYSEGWQNIDYASVSAFAYSERTHWFEKVVTLSTSQNTSITFLDDHITATSLVEVFAGRSTGDVSGGQNTFDYEDIYTTAGSCVITYPKQSEAITIKVRIYIS